MNGIFTIAAKNYLPHAFTLFESISKHEANAGFHVILTDELDGLENEFVQRCDIIESRNIGIPKFQEMAFKYNVVEFCTSVKPFVFEYLFKKYNYDKIIYLDPDICLYAAMEDAWCCLDTDFAVITPHITEPYVNYEGATSEEELLFVGIYNLGFIGLSNNAQTKQLLLWWKKKLENQCFGDKTDSLHVDQRWIDFLPALYEKGVKILRHPGYNAAMWNLHERSFDNKSGGYTVNNNYSLIMFHFSGLVPESYELICRKQNKYTLHNRPELKDLFEEYVKALLANGFQKMKNAKYKYGHFDNGYIVTAFQRRFLRGKLQQGASYEFPFSAQGKWYKLLEKNNLIVKRTRNSLDTMSRAHVANYSAKSNIIYGLARLIKNMIGIERYYFILRFVAKHIRFEDQMFLIGKDE